MPYRCPKACLKGRRRVSSLAAFVETSYRILLLWFALALHSSPAIEPGTGDGFWHTRGNQMLDSSNRPVRIAGVNWYGFETTAAIPGGLDLQDYRTIVQSIHHSGYNTIRIPFSNQMVESPAIPTNIKFTNRSGPINADLKGLNSLEILDRIIAYAGQQGLKVILDNHRSEAGDGTGLSGLWFTQGYPESAWIADWQMLTHRYANNPTVVGMDLRNEPHNASANGACWGCGGTNDWRLAAERAGNAVLAINPHALIFVEGVDSFENDFYWWGGNLEGVRTAPVRLATRNQLVYSAHDYGPVESGQSWFTPTMSDASLNAVWTKHWAYISQENIAPVWLGEFGVTIPASPDNPTPAETMEAKWFQSIIQFLHSDTHISWTYWTLNGEDHYGILNANYDDIRNSDRQSALATIQFPLGIGLVKGGRTASTIIEPVRPAQPVATKPMAAGKQSPGETHCQVVYTNSNDWKVGFSSGLTIRNTGTAPINGWILTWSWDGNQKIDQLWSAHYTQNGSSITVTNESWNAAIPAAGELTGIGFNATYSGQNHAPTKFYLNGTLCN
jgi:endoglucanase